MRILFILLLLIISAKAQIFTETFDNYLRTVGDESANFIFQQESHTGVADSIHHDLTANDKHLNYVGYNSSYAIMIGLLAAGNPYYNGGKGLPFNGTDDNMHAYSATEDWFDPGTSDFSFTLFIKTGAAPASDFYWDKRTAFTGANGYSAGFTSATAQARCILTTTGGFTQVTGEILSANTNYVITAVYDRDGNASLYVNTTAPATGSIAAFSAVSIANTHLVNIGAAWDNSGLTSFSLYAVKYFKRVVTQKEHNELMALAEGWKSGGGNVVRVIGNFYQGISGSGLTVKTKAGGSGDGFTYTPTLTGSFAEYSYQVPSAFTFDADSIMFKTDTDSIWHSIPDTTLPDGYGLELVFRAKETGGVVYEDSLYVQGYTIPPATTTGKFKTTFTPFTNIFTDF